MLKPEALVRNYVDALRTDNWEDAYHHLIEMGDDVIPIVGDALQHRSDAGLRQILVRVLWQTRSDLAVPFLAEALEDPDSAVWKEALDGLVAIGSRPASECLSAAREHAGATLGSWLDEAIGQIRQRRNTGIT